MKKKNNKLKNVQTVLWLWVPGPTQRDFRILNFRIFDDFAQQKMSVYLAGSIDILCFVFPRSPAEANLKFAPNSSRIDGDFLS